MKLLVFFALTLALLITNSTSFGQEVESTQAEVADTTQAQVADTSEPEVTDTQPELSTDDGFMIVKASREKVKLPLFFAAKEEAQIIVSHDKIRQRIELTLTVLQGAPNGLSLSLNGSGVVQNVEGPEVAYWAVKESSGEDKQRSLVIYPSNADQEVKEPKEFTVTVFTETSFDLEQGEVSTLTLGPGDSVGLRGILEVIPDDTVDIEVINQEALLRMGDINREDQPRQQRFQIYGEHFLNLKVNPRGAALLPVEMVGGRLVGVVSEDQESVSFEMSGEVRVEKEGGAFLEVLSGDAALTKLPELVGADLQVKYQEDGAPVYGVNFPSPGNYALTLSFTANVKREGETRVVRFRVPGSGLTELTLSGLPEGATFDPARDTYLINTDGEWSGFMPSNGLCDMAWTTARKGEESRRFFSTSAVVDARVSAGLLRQETLLSVNVLQGELETLSIRVDGPGDVLDVQGEGVLRWGVSSNAEGERELELVFNQPLRESGEWSIRSQATLGEFPVRERVLRLIPQGVVHHSGHLRLVGEGAVRVDIGDAEGITQLAPSQFPEGLPDPGDRQVLVYRFPSATYDFELLVEPILPEVSVSQVVVHELTDADRVISAAIEIDIREASIRDWDVGIPEDFVVVGVEGITVSDFNLNEPTEGDDRLVKITFSDAVIGRQLVRIRLERREAAAEGAWVLQPLIYPESRSVRGFIGVAAVPGYRVGVGDVSELTEIPTSQFPSQVPGLQQAFRIRSAEWTASMNIEALGQTIQADVFHLYSLKQGLAYGSVLLNYFVGGAPVNEWRIQVPEEMGNVSIDGQEVQSWRREGDQVIVTLHQSVMGPATVLLTFEQPMSARGGSLRLGQVQPLDVEGERGYVHVVSPYQVKSEMSVVSEGLLSIEPLELPTEFRLFTSAPTVAAYQYTGRPFELEMNLEWYVSADTIEQVIDFARFTSDVSRDGEVVTEAQYYVKSRGGQTLRFRMPAEVTLWEVKVGNEVVNARQDGEFLLIPLTATTDPNEVVQVGVRLGQTNANADRPQVMAPTAVVSTMMVEWEITGERGRVLQANGPSRSNLVKLPVTETGFEWIYKHAIKFMGVLIFIILLGYGFISQATKRWHLFLGALVIGVGGLLCLRIAYEALSNRQVNLSQLQFAIPAVAPEQALVLELTNETRWMAMLSWPGVIAIFVGVALLLLGLIKKSWGRTLIFSAGFLFIAIGVLDQHGGAIPFWLCLGVFIVASAYRRIWLKNKTIPTQKMAETPTPAVSCLLPWILGAACFLGASSTDARADVPGVSLLEESWRIEEGRLYGEFELQVKGEEGESLLLLKEPAFLTRFESEKTRVARRQMGNETHSFLILNETGAHQVYAEFEMGLPDSVAEFAIPTPSAAIHWLNVEIDQTGFEVKSPTAVLSGPLNGLPEGASGARLLLRPANEAVLQLVPRTRDLSLEDRQFFVETFNLYRPNPGVVDALHRVSVRPSQGEVAELRFGVPEGFTVSDLRGGAVKSWRFDPEDGELRVDLDPPQGEVFSIEIESQRPMGDLPNEVTLSGLRAMDAEGEVNTVGIAFGNDTQADTFTAEGMSSIDVSEFDNDLLRDEEGNAIAELQRVYRQQAEDGSVVVRVLPVEPDVRATTLQTLSMGSDRVVLAVETVVDVSRAGVFKLSFPLPEGLEIEAITGDNLSHYTEGVENDQRIISVQMKERALGEQRFNVSFTGAAPGAQAEWSVPRFMIREARRQSGQLIIASETGLRVQSVGRDQVSEIDARQITNQQKSALAFKLLQSDWSLTLRIEALEPWITARVLEEITLREGLSRTRLAVRYQIENASVDRLRFTLPGLATEEARSVRAQGEGVQDVVPIEGEDGVWELRFHRRMLGEVPVEIRFQRTGGRSSGPEDLSVTRFTNVRQLSHWFVVRAAGRLEIEAPNLAAGWQRADWANVPPELYDSRDKGAPSLCLKVSEAEAPLRIQVQRNEVADALKLRVKEGELTSVFSINGEILTRMDMQVEVMENSPLRIDLPKDARLMNAFANGQSISVAREGDGYLLSISPAEDSSASSISFVYAEPLKNDHLKVGLEGPRLSIPLQNIEWKVYLPEGYRLRDAEGDLDLTSEEHRFAVPRFDYSEVAQSRQLEEADAARGLVEQANAWIRDGNQSSARDALQRASKKGQSLDPATNEDARVQLHRLQTEQAVVGLNTLRQKLYLDNRASMVDPNRAALFDKASMSNSIIGGAENYNPDELNVIQQGNTTEENEALKRIADRIVLQQLATEPALQAIELTLPEQGKILEFSRRVQVNGDEPLRLDLELAQRSSVPVWFVISLLVVVALIARLGAPQRSRATVESAA